MDDKKRDALMWVIGAALLVTIVFSVRDTAREMMFDSKKVGSIAEIEIPAVPDVKTDRD